MTRFLLVVAWGAALLSAAACSGVRSSLRYGPDGQREYFVECTDLPLTYCYDRALKLCPGGYFLVKEEQIPQGAKSGSAFAQWTHIGGTSNKTTTSFMNHVVVRCKSGQDSQAPAP
ncbi:MAG: hypothetical protein HY927_01830 [Elusimicrobia bacterium]|nr:hypothetical protein [Elusimicrobiota bacterium]